MLRKICNIGNSQGVSLPKEILEKLHLSVGLEVDVELDEKGKRIVIEPMPTRAAYEAVDREFASQVSDFIERYKPALKALAK
ncbi:MAG: AbrB/MazE/SpoVT family DNA-binding domain-containing protein [Deltaproteobacteria bacterium]|nr:AbrB/MazE/SpoVT family DNA-binding domain-containing protein [Deltaproteobacteria bacterium]